LSVFLFSYKNYIQTQRRESNLFYQIIVIIRKLKFYHLFWFDINNNNNNNDGNNIDKTKRTKKGGISFTRFHLPTRLPHPLSSPSLTQNLETPNPFPYLEPREREKASGWRWRWLEAAGNTTEGIWDETPLYPTPDLMKPENLKLKKPNQL